MLLDYTDEKSQIYALRALVRQNALSTFETFVKASGEDTSPVVKSSDPLKAAQEAWIDICGKIATEHNSSGMMLKYGGYPISYKDNVLKLRFSSQSHLDAANRCKQTLVRELTAITGEARVMFEVGELPEEASRREKIEDDPAAKLLFDKLGAQPLD